MGCGSSTLSPSKKVQRNIPQEYPSFSSSSSVIKINFNEKYKLKREQFGKFTFRQNGGVGQVHFASRLNDNKTFAMKFFGYTKLIPTSSSIEKEILLLEDLIDIPYISRFEGLFMDSKEGYVPNRIYDQPYPVIVMEALEGGDLFDRIHSNFTVVSERYLAASFKCIIEALHKIHQKGYLHRDIKLENLMYESERIDSPLKIIDFGLMVKISRNDGLYISRRIDGTPQYVAPETWVYKHYSYKSDIWQAGCCLYSMLSGFSPFSSEPALIVEGIYSPMEGEGWINISETAKDLLRQIFIVDPSARISTEEILQHPWLQGDAPNDSLDHNYVKRLRKLAIANKLKLLFMNDEIQKSCKLKREYLSQKLPYLFRSAKIPRKYSIELQLPNETKGSEESLPSSQNGDKYLYQKLKLLRSGLLYAVTPFQSFDSKQQESETRTKPKRFLTSEGGSSFYNQHKSEKWKVTSKHKTDSHISLLEHQTAWKGINLAEITFPNFIIILNRVDLSQLATREVFDIFDRDHTGIVDMKEFLLTILAFYPNPYDYDTTIDNHTDNDNAVRLFFNLFDVKETGCIDLEELKLVIGCLLADDIKNQSTSQLQVVTMKHVEELFDTMDLERNGIISFEEFKIFYNTILKSTVENYSSTDSY